MFPEKDNLSNKVCEEHIDLMNIKKDHYQQKMDEEIKKIKEEKESRKKMLIEKQAKARQLKVAEKRKLAKEKEIAQNEFKLSKIRAREKFKLAQGVKRQALKEVKRLQRGKEKARKQEFLTLLKERMIQEKQKKRALVSTPLVIDRPEVSFTCYVK